MTETDARGSPAVAISRHELTLDEFLKLPDEKPALEYFDGEVTQKVAPQPQHSVLQAWLIQWLNPLLRSRRWGLVLPELRCVFGGVSFVPDLAILRWERIPRDAAGRVANELIGEPDVAIESVSPEQRLMGLVRKCRWYVDHGTAIALLVNPQ